MYRYLILLFLLAYSFQAQSQQIITGKVKDASTGEALPFVSVFVKKAGTGAPTNEEGKYNIKISKPADSVSVSFIGYKTQSKAIKANLARQAIDFELEPNSFSLQEVIVRPGENPTFKIMRQVMAHKEQNDKRQLKAYQYEAYSILQLSVENLPGKKKATELPILSDSTASNRKGKKIYPFFMSESLSDFYYNRDPERTKEIVKATKVAGVGLQDSDIFSELLGVSYNNYNFYQNWITILNKSFVSPIADGWMLYYNYDLEDSLYVGNTWCYKIKVAPKRPQDLAFKGTIWITEDSYALRKIDVAVSKKKDEVSIHYNCYIILKLR